MDETHDPLCPMVTCLAGECENDYCECQCELIARVEERTRGTS